MLCLSIPTPGFPHFFLYFKSLLHRDVSVMVCFYESIAISQVFNTSTRAQQMVMHRKSCLIPILNVASFSIQIFLKRFREHTESHLFITWVGRACFVF